jgi:DNA polymerase III sliding clamp (beta) subunit (PCNA family)
LASADNTIILHAEYTESLDVDSEVTVNLPDLSRLIKILQCIDSDNIQLQIEQNHISYSSSDIRFKYHLLEDGIITPPPISTEKIKDIKYDTSFNMPYASVINLIKGSAFTLNINKVYISTKGDNVYADINDRQTCSVDNISLKLCTGYKGLSIDDPLPISFETIRTLAGTRCDAVEVLVNTELNVMMFKLNNSNISITYVVSGLVR